MTKKGTGLKIAISAILCFFILILAIRQGSVYISLKNLFGIISGHITGNGTPEGIEPMMDSIFWTIRMPRVIMAFLVGGALSVTVTQALLSRPDLTVEVTYYINGVLYRVVIPAGADLTELLNASGGIDFETLGAAFNGQRVN